jgi:hypothetical protein
MAFTPLRCVTIVDNFIIVLCNHWLYQWYFLGVLSQRKQPRFATSRCTDDIDEGCERPRRIESGVAMEADFDGAFSKTSKLFAACAKGSRASGGMALRRRVRSGPWRVLWLGRLFHSDLRCDDRRSAGYRLPLDQDRFCRSVRGGFRDPDFQLTRHYSASQENRLKSLKIEAVAPALSWNRPARDTLLLT